jgi:hypothetical protein
VLALQAAVVSHPRLGPAATAFASELATRLGCERVAVGFVEDRFSRVVALSHGALGDGSTDTLRAMGAAMDEAIEQAATVIAPAPPELPPRIILPTRSSSARRRGGVHIPIAVQHELVGAVLLQFRQEECADPAVMMEWEHAVALVGPVLHYMRHGERPWRKRLRDHLRRGWAALRSPAGGRLRLGLGVALVALAVLLLVPFQYRVGGNARVEGEIQRVLVAPVDGFLKRAWFARAIW